MAQPVMTRLRALRFEAVRPPGRAPRLAVNFDRGVHLKIVSA